MLEKLGFEKRTHVGISLSANNFIELAYINNATKTVEKYASGNVRYNNAIKEIIDFDEFKEVLQGLFDDAGLEPTECSVTLNLPNVFFGKTSQENASETPYILENLQTEIEDSYIFKRNEPRIRYATLEGRSRDQKNIIYSAFQAKVLDKIVEIFDEMNIEIERIDTSYSSLLKAVQYCNRFSKYMQKEEKAAIVLATTNSCCGFYLNGNIIKDFVEEPLAMKSYSTEEIYASVSKIATSIISKNKPQSLLIISESEDIDSELLSQSLSFDGQVDCINKSINTSEQFIDIQSDSPFIDSSMVSYMTIEAVGAAVSAYDDYPLNDINFVPEDRINKDLIQVFSYEIDLKRFILLCGITAVASAVIISLIFGSLLAAGKNSNDQETESFQQQSNAYKTKSASLSKNKDKKDIILKITQINDSNKNVINVYSALSSDAPETLFIKKFVTNSSGGIGITGEATTTAEVYKFLEGLKEKNKDLMLSKVSDNSSSQNAVIPNGYTFEIKTTNADISLTDNGFADIYDLPATSKPQSNMTFPRPISFPSSSGSGAQTAPPSSRLI